MHCPGTLRGMDTTELAFFIYSLFSGNAGFSGWKIGNFLLGLGKLMFPNFSALTEENHDKAVVVPAEIRNTDLSNLNQNSSFAAWDNLLGSPTADGETK